MPVLHEADSAARRSLEMLVLWRASRFISVYLKNKNFWSISKQDVSSRSYRVPRLILFGVGTISVPFTAAALATANVKDKDTSNKLDIFSAQLLPSASFTEISCNISSLIRSAFTARAEAKLHQEREFVEEVPPSLSENLLSSAVMGSLVLSCTVVVPAMFVGVISVPFLYGLKPFALLVMLFTSLQLIPVRYSRSLIESDLFTLLFKKTSQYFAPFRVLRPAAALDNSKTYVIALHPHGRLFIGSALIQALFRTWFPELWKTQNLFVGVNDAMLWTPVFGKLLQLMGCVSVGRASVNHVLDSGNSIMIVPGGIEEVLEGTFDDKEVLYLAKRKGFCRVAMEHGSGVVPCFCFGESSLFLHDSQLRSAPTTASDHRAPFFRGKGRRATCSLLSRESERVLGAGWPSLPLTWSSLGAGWPCGASSTATSKSASPFPSSAGTPPPLFQRSSRRKRMRQACGASRVRNAQDGAG